MKPRQRSAKALTLAGHLQQLLVEDCSWWALRDTAGIAVGQRSRCRLDSSRSWARWNLAGARATAARLSRRCRTAAGLARW